MLFTLKVLLYQFYLVFLIFKTFGAYHLHLSKYRVDCDIHFYFREHSTGEWKVLEPKVFDTTLEVTGVLPGDLISFKLYTKSDTGEIGPVYELSDVVTCKFAMEFIAIPILIANDVDV